jgi:hypothetical protein
MKAKRCLINGGQMARLIAWCFLVLILYMTVVVAVWQEAPLYHLLDRVFAFILLWVKILRL